MKYYLLLLTALVSVADAQIIPTVNLYTTYTDNLFLSSTQRGDVVNASYVDLDYVVNEDFGLYYSGSASLFSENTDLFSHLHTFGLSYTRPLRTDNLLIAGLETGLRLDRPLYDYRDFAEIRAFATLKSYLRPDLLGRIGYSLHYQNFLNANDYSYVEQRLNAQFTHVLPTRTTLQFGGELGLKSYTQASGADSFFDLSARSDQDRHLLQGISRLKAAQSLGANAGLQLEWQHRQSFTGQSRFADLLFYNPDDDLFDDQFSYDGQQLGTTLKYLAPWQSEMVASCQRESRHYSNRPAYDLSGFPTGDSAAETRQTLRLGLGRTFYPVNSWIQEAGVELEWLYRDIDSNDVFYAATARSYTIGLQLGF